MLIGIDFDNTIVSYDELMRSIARGWGLCNGAVGMSKKQIRDMMRRLPDGEVLWQRVQIAAYGLRMHEATPSEGVKDFLALCRQRGIPVRIVSHKTVRPNLGASDVDLRIAAMNWLDQGGFFSPGIGIDRQHVYFESSRAEKISRIEHLGITHFIDDLEETFDEHAFPSGVTKILYSSEPSRVGADVTALSSWAEIAAHLFQAVGHSRQKVL